VNSVLDHAGIGGISELHDLSGTRGPEFQAWSMSGFLEALHAFAGVRIDVPEQRISIAPQLPSHWPYVKVRKWYGSIPFDVNYGGDDHRRGLSVAFPWHAAPDCTFEIDLILPARRTVCDVKVAVDGEVQPAAWKVETLPGTDQQRVVLTLPASGQIDITTCMQARSARARKSA